MESKGEIILKFDYHKDGDILYGVETFIFRFQGKEAADIILLNLLDDNQFAYDIRMNEESVPTGLKIISSADSELMRSLEIELKPVFNNKREALQQAIDVISAVMIRTQKGSI